MAENEAGGYEQAGVSARAAAEGLAALGAAVHRTHANRTGVGRPLRGLGYYANVLDLGGGRGLAVACDGVGTKLMVAEATGRYDTIGQDLVAMNVNDLICVGAEPIAMLDYIAVGRPDGAVFRDFAAGLERAAAASGITIPGGEIAQVREMLRGAGPTEGFDVIGTAMGVLDLDQALFGDRVRAGDAILGLGASGLHSNGYTLARKVLCPEEGDLDRHEDALGRTVADELLEPTALYVRFANAIRSGGLTVNALCHVTGDGFMNLTRVEAPVGFELDAMPEVPPVFRLIAERGGVDAAEMHTVFNMGVGFVVIAPEDQADALLALAAEHGHPASRIGTVSDEVGMVRLPERGLEGRKGEHGLRLV